MPVSLSSRSARRDVLIAFGCLTWCAFAFAARLPLLGQLRWLFMPWNMFLAATPFALSFAMRHGLGTTGRWLLALPWLLLLPNAPYVATDLIHLTRHATSAPWHDLLLLLSCAGSGMLLGYMSLRHVQEILEIAAPRWVSRAVVGLILGLVAYGIYLGRFLRWNSWDAATRPLALCRSVCAPIVDPLGHSWVWMFTLALTAMLALGYASVELMRGKDDG